MPAIQDPYSTASTSRRIVARLARQAAIVALANKAIEALNWLYCGNRWHRQHRPVVSSSSSSSTNLRCSAAAERLRDYIFSSSADYIRRRGPTARQSGDGSAALTAILTASESFVYGTSDPASSSSVVPLRADDVSLPPTAPSVDLLAALPPEVAARYTSPDLLLRADAVYEYRHAPSKASAAEYTRLVQRLQALDMVEFTSTPSVVNGVFTVPKPNGSLRLIIDARPANNVFLPPPAVRLPLPPDLAAMEASGPFFMAGLDVADFYHRLLLPPSFRPYFALPPVRGADVGRPELEQIWPMCTTLPMGWSHSVYIAQAVHEKFLDQDPEIAAQPRLGRDQRVDPARGVNSVYLDDFNSFDGDIDQLDDRFVRTRERYPEAGLSNNAKKDVRPTDVGKAIGIEVDGSRGRIGVPVEKSQQLIAATQELLRIGACSGNALSRVVGHWTWIVLVRRPALSVFNNVYQFAAAAGRRVKPLWPSVRRELQIVCAIAPLLWASVNNNWFDRAIAFDASSYGVGVCSTPVGQAEIAAEMSHVVRGGAAVTLDAVIADPHGMQQVPLEPPLQRHHWATVISRPWRFEDHINVLEVQASLLSLRWVLSHPRSMGSRVLLFGDSQVALGCLAKGRSSSYRLLRLLRRAAALVLASGLRPVYRWLPSAANPADGPSRLR